MIAGLACCYFVFLSKTKLLTENFTGISILVYTVLFYMVNLVLLSEDLSQHCRIFFMLCHSSLRQGGGYFAHP